MSSGYRCVCCHSVQLQFSETKATCDVCKTEYLVEAGAPVFLHPSNSLFNKSTIGCHSSTGFRGGFIARVGKILPDLTFNRLQDFALEQYIDNLPKSSRCLVIGAGFDVLLLKKLEDSGHCVIGTDVILTPKTTCVCDGHDLPFSDQFFDSVIGIAVLEHVINPGQVVSEIYRVLKIGGTVFSALPFLQQVHMGKYDFQRFTLLGHRWLFKKFKVLDINRTAGAGSSLLWGISGFFQSFTANKKIDLLVKAAIRVLFFWVKYFDLLHPKTTNDFVLGTYLIAEKEAGYHLDKHTLLTLYSEKK